MPLGIYIAGAGGQLSMQKLNDISYNLANVNTVGFMKERTAFSTFMAGKLQDGAVAYPDRGGHKLDTRHGNIQQTANALDFAINGNGYFRIRLTDGTEAYTRAGNFQLNADGNLVTVGGRPVLDDGSSPISLPPGRLTVSADGSINVNGQSAGRIGLARIIDPGNIRKIGDAMLTTPPGNVKPAGNDVHVMQGALEGSNVNSVLAMTELVSATRSFQGMTKTMQQYNHIATLLNEQVGRVQTP